MSDLRSSLSNEQRNKLRSELAGSIKNDRNSTALRSTNRGTTVSQNSASSGLRGASNDLQKLKMFSKQYEQTRNAYLQFQNGNVNITNFIAATAASKGNFAENFFACLGGFVIGIVLGVIVALAGEGLMALATPVACAIAAVYIKNSSKDKKVKQLQDSLLKRSEEFAAKLKPFYEKTNKAVAFSYASPFIVDKLIEYIEVGRCDTLKECLNLYEQEKAQYEQLKVLNQINMHATNTAAAASYLAFDTMVKNFFG